MEIEGPPHFPGQYIHLFQQKEQVFLGMETADGQHPPAVRPCVGRTKKGCIDTIGNAGRPYAVAVGGDLPKAPGRGDDGSGVFQHQASQRL